MCCIDLFILFDAPEIGEAMQKRNVGYDVIRILSILLVVIIHSNVAYLGANEGSVAWYFVMLVTSVCLVAVPLFFMISGALLLDTDEIIPLNKLFSKRILKQAIPFIVWSLIYVAARIVMRKIPFGLAAFTDLIHEPAYYQFWFMYSLLAIYLLLPVLQAIVIKLDKKHLEYALLIWLLFSTVFPVLQRYIPGFEISGHADLILCEGYVGYFLLGYYLKKYHSQLSLKWGAVLAASGIAVTGILSVVEYLLSAEGGYSGYFYQSYLTPFVVIAATGLFILFGGIKTPRNEKLGAVIKALSASSIGVYYIHMLVLTAIEYVGFVGDSSIVILAVKTVATYCVSLVAAFIISKIPYVKKILLGL